MKSPIFKIALFAVAFGLAASATAKTTCEELTTQIEAKIKAKGVKDFTLTTVDKDEKSDLKVVGTCDGGAKKILYKRG
jgi:hypothetical protein